MRTMTITTTTTSSGSNSFRNIPKIPFINFMKWSTSQRMRRDNPFIHQAGLGLGSSTRRDICLVYEDHADLTVYVLQNYMNIDIFLQFLE